MKRLAGVLLLMLALPAGGEIYPLPPEGIDVIGNVSVVAAVALAITISLGRIRTWMSGYPARARAWCCRRVSSYPRRRVKGWS